MQTTTSLPTKSIAVPPQVVAELLIHLDREEAFFVDLLESIHRIRPHALRGDEEDWPSELERLRAASETLSRQRQHLQRTVDPGKRGDRLKLAELHLSTADRRKLDQRCRDVRVIAARAAGTVRGLFVALSAWNDVTRATLDALLGVVPQEHTYSASGARVNPARPPILETRS